MLQQYEHVEGIVENLDALTKSQKLKIEADLEMLYLSRKLAEIKCDVPIQYDLEKAKLNLDHEKVLNKFNEVGMKGLQRFLKSNKNRLKTESVFHCGRHFLNYFR